MLSLIGSGKSVPEIARILGRPEHGTRFRLKKLRSRAVPAPDAPAVETEKPLTCNQQAVLRHLGGLADDFTAADDLYLVEKSCQGVPMDVVADDLGCDVRTVKQRWRALMCEAVTDPRGTGRLTLSGQVDLLFALRHRAAADA